jgi:hypothetical protein
MQVCCQPHISVRLISGKVEPSDKYGLIAIRLGIPTGSFHGKVTLKQGWGANRGVGYPCIRFLWRYISGSVKNFCQQVQTSNHGNTFLKPAIFTLGPIVTGKCTTIKTLFFGKNVHMFHFAAPGKIIPSRPRESGQIPPETTYLPWPLFLGGK